MSRKLLIAGGIAALVLVMQGRRGVSVTGTKLSSIATGRNWNSEQLEMMDIIQARFNAAGYDDRAAAAAIVNAIAESNLNPRADARVTIGEDSLGLFQLYAAGGGAGMTDAERFDPILNTDRIIEESKRGKGANFLADYQDGKGFLDLVYSFTVNVERPANSEQKGQERAALGEKVFPTLA